MIGLDGEERQRLLSASSSVDKIYNKVQLGGFVIACRLSCINSCAERSRLDPL
jgi:hypothetical protein